MENARSRVRICVTYFAALFLFLGGALFIAFLLYRGDTDRALNLFMAILPVTASIIAFWFGNRAVDKKERSEDGNVQKGDKEGSGS